MYGNGIIQNKYQVDTLTNQINFTAKVAATSAKNNDQKMHG